MSLSGAYLDLHGAAAAAQPTAAPASSALQSDPVFEEIKRRAANPAVAKKVNAVIGYEITKGGKVAKTWSKSGHQVAKASVVNRMCCLVRINCIINYVIIVWFLVTCELTNIGN